MAKQTKIIYEFPRGYFKKRLKEWEPTFPNPLETAREYLDSATKDEIRKKTEYITLPGLAPPGCSRWETERKPAPDWSTYREVKELLHREYKDEPPTRKVSTRLIVYDDVEETDEQKTIIHEACCFLNVNEDVLTFEQRNKLVELWPRHDGVLQVHLLGYEIKEI